MKKQIVNYCGTCKRETQHHVFECEENLGERVLENIIPFGFINIRPYRRYKCECTSCSDMKTVLR